MEARRDMDDRESKKMKMDEGNEGSSTPSKVVHVRNLPLDCTEYELRMLVPYPHQPVQLLFLKGKGQAFVELKDVVAASQFIDNYHTQPARVRNKQVYLQFSKRQELDVPAPTVSATSNGGSIIHVTIMDCFYPVSVEILCSVFQYHGQILKIVIFTKKDQGNNVNALIQYAEAVSANAAKMTMNGKNLYEGCGILRIQDSNLKDLTVEFNNERSWDFTRQLPPGPPNKPLMMSKGGILPVSSPFQPGNPLFHPGSPDFAGGANSVLLIGNLNDAKVTPDVLFALFSCYGDVQRIKILYNKRDNALVQFTNSQQAATAMRNLNGVSLFGKSLNITVSNKSSIKMPQSGSEENSAAFNKDFSSSEFHRFKVVGSKNYQNICPPSATLHISNIPTPDGQRLQDLFSQYGRVVGFKFFPNNEKMALLQMGSIPEAVEALTGMHLFPMSDNTRLRVAFSKSSL